MSSPRATTVGTVIRFGVFEVDLRAGELRKQGVRVKLQEQPLQILQFLLERSGEVVTREELRQRIWPADTFVDFDHGLYNAIRRLREALGDSAENPRFIETLSRRGYRFIGSVSVSGNTNGATESRGASPQAPHLGSLAQAMPSITEATAEPVAPNEHGQVALNPSTPLAEKTPKWALRSYRLSFRVLAGCIGLLLVLALLAAVPSARERLLGSRSSPPIRSVAVLPLQNLSGDPAQDYFADSMTEELITELSHIGRLKIVSHTSVMQYKKTDKSLPEIARELNVDAIMEGSVLRSGRRVRITAQLIGAANDTNLWAQTYDRDWNDVLVVTGEVAGAIADNVRVEMTPEERQTLEKLRRVNLKAVDLYNEGRFHLDRAQRLGIYAGKNQAFRKEMRKAVSLFEQATEEDTSYVPAYIGISSALESDFTAALTPELIPKAKAALAKALELDESRAETHIAKANMHWRWDWNIPAAEKELQRALQLDPHSAEAHQSYSDLLHAMKRIDEAQKERELAQQLDPVHNHSTVNLDDRLNIDESRKQVAEMSPDDGVAHAWVAKGYIRDRRYKEGVEEYEKAASLLGYSDIAQTLQRGLAAGNYKESLRESMKQWEALSRRQYLVVYWPAFVYASLGDKEDAFRWLQKAAEEHSWCMMFLSNDPVWDPIRSDPRFAELVRRTGLPQ
jgi:TolB-like protein/DNA-binding winged helix-turn-helix (wHTH) protein/Tfp pilus assembly protein PilF